MTQYSFEMKKNDTITAHPGGNELFSYTVYLTVDRVYLTL